MADYAPYGYLVQGSDTLSDPTECSFEGESGVAFQKTLTGDTGFTKGIPEVNISCSGAVKRQAVETKRLLRIWLLQQDVTFRFRVADVFCVSTGKLTGFSFKTGVGQNVVFDFKFHGSIAPGDIQDA